MGKKTGLKRSIAPYVAIIADMIGSRSLQGADRMRAQARFTEFVTQLNRSNAYSSTLVSKFAITLGDEFQAVFSDASAITDLIWELANVRDLPAFRIGVGYGRVETVIPEIAINLDGPCLHNARKAVEIAKQTRMHAVFVGFGREVDQMAIGVAGLLAAHMEKWTSDQLVIAGLRRQGLSLEGIAEARSLSIQAVAASLFASRWKAFVDGERALHTILQLGTRKKGISLLG